MWDTWRGWLGLDHFSHVYPIRFQFDDQCGSVQQHAMELNNIVNRILRTTGYEEVNIVGQSKGGLDARWYLASGGADKVANLIMIGTPNAGTEAAYYDATGCPRGAAKDLLPGSLATRVIDRPENTNYYTIAGNWMPTGACIWSRDPGNCYIPGEDDGFAAVDSVQSNADYIPLGPSPPSYHLDLLEERDAYDMALQVLDGKKITDEK